MSDSNSLAEIERQAGAAFLPDQTGQTLAAHFGDPEAEYAAAQAESVLFDFGARTHIELTGRDGQKFLHNFCTNEVRGLKPGQGCEAFVTSVQGKVLAHIFVFAAPHSLWIETVPGAERKLIDHLSKYAITEEVEFHPRSADWGELFVTGPETENRLAAAGFECALLVPYAHRAAEPEGPPHFIRRVDFLGQPGYLLFAPIADLPSIWNRVVAAGVRPAGRQAFHALRIEAGMPWYGLDISDDNLAQEVSRTSDAICFTKGCYLGQEPIARIDALGHVNQELRGIRFSAEPLPAPGSSIVVPGQNREIGRITSSAISYTDDMPVALGYLKRNYATGGTAVAVRSDDKEIPGVVFWH